MRRPSTVSRLVTWGEFRARDSFDLPTAELAGINRWLIPRSRLTCFFILGFVYLLAIVGVDLPVAYITLLCAIAVAMSLPFQAWLDSGRALGLLVYTQFTFDIVLLTIGLASLPQVPVLLHLQLLMVIVPCALLSRGCGTIMASLAIAAHLFLVWLRGSYSTIEVLGPIYFFAILAHQCFFYGARLATKTHQAEDESVLTAALLRVADELAAEHTSTALVQRLAVLAKELSGASWTAVVLRDAERETFEIRALVSRHGIIDDEVLSVGPPPDIARDPRLATGADDGCIVVDSVESSLLPRELHERWRAGSYLASVLRRSGEAVGILLVGFDDASRLRSERTRRLVIGMARQALLALENARLVEDLQRASGLKTEFISTISHELRSPLHAIIGYTEILRDEEAAAAVGSDASRGDMLERVRVHALHLHEMIEATLSVSRMESGRLPIRLATLSLPALLAEVAAEIPDFRRKPEVALEWDLPAGFPPLLSDPGKLKMIVRNLVDNALKFTDAGRVSVLVRLEHAPQDGTPDEGATARLGIVVTDTGIGIPPELCATVFEMYRQGDGSLTRRYAGLGLGLYIVKRLVEGLQGRILLESTPGSGTRFHITLPVVIARAASDSVADAVTH
jgi:signal transduction histidine kinase